MIVDFKELEPGVFLHIDSNETYIKFKHLLEFENCDPINCARVSDGSVYWFDENEKCCPIDRKNPIRHENYIEG